MARSGRSGWRYLFWQWAPSMADPPWIRSAPVAIALIFPVVVIFSVPSRSASSTDWHVREAKTVVVDGVEEVWQLRWLDKPHSSCGPDGGDANLTCPCSGCAYGLKGQIALVRKRKGHPDERLNLAAAFPNEYPNGRDQKQKAEVTIQQWAPVLEGPDSDLNHAEDDDFAARVERRPPVELMQFGDFDHDGGATEFLIQVSTLPCGKHQMALFGISRSNPHLHVFSTVENPKAPLVLGNWEWDALLRSNGRVSVTDWNCDDHGSDAEWRIEMEARNGVLHAKNVGFSCPTGGTARTAVST